MYSAWLFCFDHVAEIAQKLSIQECLFPVPPTLTDALKIFRSKTKML
jgi:hypothetical protein